MGSMTISPVLAEQTQTIMNAVAPNGYAFSVSLELYSSSNANFHYSPIKIESMVIDQAFGPRFTDRIIVGFQIRTSDYLTLFANNTDLMAQIILTPVNRNTGQRVIGELPKITKYKAILLNPQDLAAKYNIQDLTTTRNSPAMDNILSNFLTTEVQLLETEYYEVRSKSFAGTIRDADVNATIGYIARRLGIRSHKRVPADNLNLIPAMTIPLGKDLGNIFDFIQRNYGVYYKGIDWYYTQGMLYVYPPFEVDKIDASEVVNVYSVPVGMYGGSIGYHTNPSPHLLHIVSNSPTSITDLSKQGAEDSGNVAIVVPSENIIDGYSTTTDEGSAVNNLTTQVVFSKDAIPADSKSAQVTYAGITDNVFAVSSDLALKQATILTCEWYTAEPFLIYPGHSVRYHYDSETKYTTRKGIIEGVSYNFVALGSVSGTYVFTCTAKLLLRLTNKKDV